MNDLSVKVKFHVGNGKTGHKELREGEAPADVPTGRIPRISKLMALAIRFEQLIRDGVVANQAEIAKLGFVSRARVSQIMDLLSLSPELQEELLFLPRVERGRDPVTERELRAVVAEVDWERQRERLRGHVMCLGESRTHSIDSQSCLRGAGLQLLVQPKLIQTEPVSTVADVVSQGARARPLEPQAHSGHAGPVLAGPHAWSCNPTSDSGPRNPPSGAEFRCRHLVTHSMATDTSTTDLAYADTLWKAADVLRGQIDAAEYKHVVLGLLFLKYISDSFEARRDELKAELEADGITGDQLESLLENRDEYTAERVFWVPPDARWQNLQNQATRPDVATLIDDAILAVERDNPNLKGKLPRDYARRGIAPEKMKGLIDLIADIGFKGDRAKARDTLGRVYEYFLGKFAQAEGKLGGEFFTPRCIVRLLVEMLEPYEGRIYDPCCGSAGMFVQSERFVEAHGGEKTDISIFGQESNPTTWRLAHMNLAIRGIEANLGSQPADSFLRNLHPDLKADYILANPPFNVSDWSGKLLSDDVRWRYGTPPTGNANYAWIQHFIHHLAPPNGHGGGVAGFVMANGSLSSGSGGEGEIRQRIVEADLVDCIVALPAQLFLTTGIPACLWFLSRDKTGKNLKHGGRDRSGETLFVDARKLGTMQTRTLRVLTGGDDGESMLADGMGDPNADSDIGRIVYAYRQWRGEPAPDWWDDSEHGAWEYGDIPGFCKSETIEGIGKHGFVLTPGRYVGAEEQEDDGEPFAEKYPRLLAELEECFAQSDKLQSTIRQNLAGLGASLEGNS